MVSLADKKAQVEKMKTKISIKKGDTQTQQDGVESNMSKKTPIDFVTESAAYAASSDSALSSDRQKTTTKKKVVMPTIQDKQYSIDIENGSKKYPGLTLEEEAELDSDSRLSSIMKENKYSDMIAEKQERARLDDRAEIRKQYISGQATSGDEDYDKSLVAMSQATDGIREKLIASGAKGLNKVSDIDLIKQIYETNPYTSDIVNGITNGTIPPEYGTAFLLDGDAYKQVIDEFAKQQSVQPSGKKGKAGRFESFVQGAFDTVTGTIKSIGNLALSVGTPAKNVLEYIIEQDTGKSTKDVWGEITDQLKQDKQYRKGWYTAGNVTGELGLSVLAGAGTEALASEVGGAIGSSLAESKYAPEILKAGEKLEKFNSSQVGKWTKGLLGWIDDAVKGGIELQAIDDLVEGELSSTKDYMSTIEIGLVLGALGRVGSKARKKLANPGKKIEEIVTGEGALSKKSINQIENEVANFNITNKADNPFRLRANEVKVEALPKLEGEIEKLSNERSSIISNMANDGQKATNEYIDLLNKQLSDVDIGTAKVVVKDGKLAVEGGSTAGSDAMAQLNEFVDMINAQSAGGTKSLIDTIASAKQIAYESSKSGKTNKMTKAITQFSKSMEAEVKKVYPKQWKQIEPLNEQLSNLLGKKSIINKLGDDYSTVAKTMGSDTDFYRFMEDLYKDGYTTEHMGNKVLGTYYTMGLRAPQTLSEQAKLFYPSIPGLEEAGIKRFQKQAQQAYGGLGALAGEEVSTSLGAIAELGGKGYQLKNA